MLGVLALRIIAGFVMPPVLAQLSGSAVMPASDYVDECGDLGLVSIDPTYPLFVLAFCIFHKPTYIESVVPALQRFKFKHFGHDMVVLHEHEIRKTEGAFKFLFDKDRRNEFMSDLSAIIEAAEFTLVASVIRKDQWKGRVDDSTNLDHVALRLGLETVHQFLATKGQPDRLIYVVCEARGHKEDKDLELEFRRFCDGQNSSQAQLPLSVIFSHKQCNSSGLQLADLIARPIGRKTLQPDQPNRAYDILAGKFDRGPDGQTDGWGLKIFPA